MTKLIKMYMDYLDTFALVNRDTGLVPLTEQQFVDLLVGENYPGKGYNNSEEVGNGQQIQH